MRKNQQPLAVHCLGKNAKSAATEGNKKRDKLGDKTSGRPAHHPTSKRTP
jgi:hypothetical protein